MEVHTGLCLLLSVKLKLLFSALCMVFEHTLLLPASFKFSCQKHLNGFALCLCFPNRPTCNFRGKGDWCVFVLLCLEKDITDTNRVSRICGVQSPAVWLMDYGSAALPRWQDFTPALMDRAHPIPVLSFLAVCSLICLDVHGKVSLNDLSHILICNLVDNENQRI